MKATTPMSEHRCITNRWVTPLAGGLFLLIADAKQYTAYLGYVRDPRGPFTSIPGRSSGGASASPS